MAEPPQLPDLTIAFRDGAPTTPEFRRRLRQDAELLLELADARLLALALALPPRPNPQAEWPLPTDDELLSYLVSIDDIERQRAFETSIKGNPRIFNRLVELRAALSGEVDLADGRERPVVRAFPHRQRFGTARFRRANGHLEFSPTGLMRGASVEGDLTPERQRRPSRVEHRMDFAASYYVGDAPLVPNSEELTYLAQQSDELGTTLRRAAQMVNEADDAASSAQASKLFLAIEHAANTLAERIAIAVRMARTSGKAPSLDSMEDARESSRFLAFKRAPTDRVEWQSRLQIWDADLTVGITGSSGPPMHIQIEIRKDSGEPERGALATIVRPKRSFDSAETDENGTCQLPLHIGDSVLLMEAGRALELRLQSSR